MSLLHEIQTAATASAVPVSEVLRRCKVLAARTGSRELAEWAGYELNGYPADRTPDAGSFPTYDALPAYRVIPHVESRGTFLGYGGQSIKNAPIPPSLLPEPYQTWARSAYLVEGVGAYEALLAGAPRGILQNAWPADLLRAYGTRIMQHMNCVEAHKVISRGAIAHLLDSVRTRVLDFVLELERAAPTAGEATPGAAPPFDPSTERIVSQAFHTHIYGNVGNVANGGADVRQTAHLTVPPADWNALAGELRRLGVPDADAAALRRALAADRRTGSATSAAGAGGTAPELGRRTGAWLATALGKAAGGAWDLSLATASTALPKLLSAHLGLPAGS